MNTWIVFLRGINVGGKNRLPMKELRVALEEGGFAHVRTYIQSGNVIVGHDAKKGDQLATTIAEIIKRAHGFRPAVLVISATALETAAKGNPFGEGDGLDKVLHLYFLADEPTAPEFEKMDAIKGAREAYALMGKIFYLYTPDGFGKSKLAQRVEKLLGVAATARNGRTVNKVLEMAQD